MGVRGNIDLTTEKCIPSPTRASQAKELIFYANVIRRLFYLVALRLNGFSLAI